MTETNAPICDTIIDDCSSSSSFIDVTPNKDGGVLKEILTEGSGEDHPISGDVVSVHYVGTLEEDGSPFDSSRDRGEKFEFTLGKGEVIKSWDYGVATMKRGEKCRLICKSEYAYGETGSAPKIPPSATLIFEVELFSWKGEDLSQKKDGGITRRILQEGGGYQTPNEGALVDINLVGRVNETIFDERDVKFIIGEGPIHNIPEGLEKALEKFKLNEKSKISLTPKYTFGSEGNKELGIPANTDVDYTVHLNSFEKAKEAWEMSQEEKIDQAVLFKEKGTTFFKQEKYRMAIKQYRKIIDFLSYDSGLDDLKKDESRNLNLAGNLNLSMSYLKIKDYIHAIEYATKAVELDPVNVKAYFRRGQANLALGYSDEAAPDFKKCLELESDNKSAKVQLNACMKIQNEQRVKEKKMYGGMFDKFAKADTQAKMASMKNGNVMSGDLGQWDTTEKKENGENVENVEDGEKKMTEDGEEYDFSSINDIKMI